MKIKDIRYVPIPYAYKLLAEALPRGEEQPYSEIVYRTLNYLRMFSKCTSDNAVKAVERLKTEFGLNEYTCVLIVNIRPRTVYELKAILAAAKTGLTLTDEDLKKIIEVLDEVCGQQQ
ncbi:RNA polymerase Rpb4 [Pyrolobus fumarii 1A]|uniref:DNA-directed RNA polymerase subunit Rpo4 n=1 Tax=Pyrolobus fumarii (strain DSM 11204 / 1A) TaxID=694429 RepID=G0EEJ9_PYRF1|nr:RNA polymerase Rpb4 [Pyrolobus fumarii]AEM38040.1 RNA polymerase Rpb4 [Pyrolobus fumarii 1A]